MKKQLFAVSAALLLSLGAQAQVDRSVMPNAGATPTIQLKSPKTFQLKNGLKVLVVEDHKLPKVSATLTLDNYPTTEADKAGVSNLMGECLGSGTENINKDAFNERIDFLGARLSFWSTGSRAFSLSKYFDEVLGMMADGVLNPKFTEDEFSKVKEQAKEGLKSDGKSAKAISGKVSNALTYGKNHPYGEFMTSTTLDNISLEDVKNTYKENFKPNHAYLIIIGDVNYKKVKKKVNKLFKNWERSVEPRFQFKSVENVSKTEINFVDVPNAVQSEINITSTINLKKSNPDFHALLVANQIFGGDFSSYLNMNLREAHGWTYGARSSVQSDKYVGEFSASTSVRNSVTDSAIVESIKELNRILTEDIDADGLARVKSKYTGNFVMGMQKPRTIANYALSIETNNLEKDYYKTYLKKINAVTIEDVKRVANKYFLKDNLRIIVVGKGSDVVESLEKLPYEIKYFDKEANSVAKPVFKKPLPKGLTAKNVIDNHIKAIGGKDKLMKIKNSYAQYEAKMGPRSLTMTKKLMAPNKSYSDLAMGTMVMQKSAFNGKSGYSEAQGQKIPMEGEDLKSEMEKSQPFEILNTTGKLIAIEKVNGKDAYVLEISKDKKMYFDIESSLKVREQSVQETPQGDMTTSIDLSNYKEYNGVKMPENISITFGPRTLDFNAVKIELNSKLVKSKDFN